MTKLLRRGGRRPLSVHRRLVVDGCHFARRVPLFPVERLVNLDDVSWLRSNSATRVSWSAVFLKATALVAAEHAPLRQAYMRWPWPHLYEHDHSIGMLAINRRAGNEERLCWGRFGRPENSSLVDIQRQLDRYLNEPVETVFKKQVFLSRLPRPIRRLAWWVNLNVSGAKRAKRLGTFSLSTLAGEGAWNRFHFTVLTSTLSFGPLDDEGRSLVTLICDHRVIDGALAARALVTLEDVMQGPIACELAGLANVRAA